MASGTKTGRATRPRGPRIDVWVTEGELAELADRADQVGMSRSAYLRTVGLNHKIRSVYDLQAVRDMGKVNELLPVSWTPR
ncbi:plasmid mobilization protein [Sphingomonas paucimobilis]|uniref:plasmid mobilization protein n=1 Tax=Sphingomonas paucimobilis TaxID=13689 RepID=UPI003F73F892